MTTATQQIAYDRSITMTTMPASIGIAELYERHSEAVFRAALRVTGNVADAEDVLQTVFLRILTNRAGSDVTSLQAAYFRRAAVNAAVDLLRRRMVHAESAYDDLAPHAAVAPPSLLKERLRRAIATLGDEDATMFVLRFVEGVSNEELAAVFGLEKNTIAVRIHRIRHRLQAELER